MPTADKINRTDRYCIGAVGRATRDCWPDSGARRPYDPSWEESETVDSRDAARYGAAGALCFQRDRYRYLCSVIYGRARARDSAKISAGRARARRAPAAAGTLPSGGGGARRGVPGGGERRSAGRVVGRGRCGQRVARGAAMAAARQAAATRALPRLLAAVAGNRARRRRACAPRLPPAALDTRRIDQPPPRLQ